MDLVEHDGPCSTFDGVTMVNFEINYDATYCVEWPNLRVVHNGKQIADVVCDKNKFDFTLKQEEQNLLELHWTNKTERHTKSEDGKIMEDQTFTMGLIRVDGILIENWFFTDGYYVPNYFKGFVESHVKNRTNYPLAEKLPSQKIWHFPGTYYFQKWEGDFWDWYYNTKIGKEVVRFTDKDPERIAKYRDTLDPCTDLVAKLKELIK